MGSKNFSILHQNIQSLRANFDVFSVYVASLITPPDLIFVSEIWIYESECSSFNLPNYNFEACCNDSYRAGGVGVFIHNDLAKSSLQCFNWSSADAIILDIKLNKQVWSFLCIYRFHNANITTFCNDLDNLLRSINNNNIVMLGDININLLNSSISYNYQTILASYGFRSFLNEPTRKLSCLDHVFVKCSNRFDCSVVNLPIHFSDHNLIKLDIALLLNRVLPVDHSTNMSRIDYIKLNDNLLRENWHDVYSEHNCNIAFEKFIYILKSHVDLSSYTVTYQKIKKLKPWMNSNLLYNINKLKKFSKKLRAHPNNARLAKFVKKLSNNVKANVKITKNLFYKKKFDSLGNNSKQCWKVVDEVLGRNSNKGHISQIYNNHSDMYITCPLSISNEFNKFFINVSLSTTSNFALGSTTDSNRFIHGVSKNFSSSCFFEPINSIEILSEINKLKNKASKGIDGIDNLILKNCSWYLLDVLRHLFNLSLSSGVFPDVLKLAVVIPIFKKGDECQLTNYRPISLLSTFSKIFEKLIKRRLINYLEKISFLHGKQFGFTAGKSSEEALLHFLSNIFIAENNSKKATALFIDIAKAFDTVDHNILISKLANIGIRGNILTWFESYLLHRRQVVKIDETYSEVGDLNCGVPQGSVLGPLLFIIYFNSIFYIDLTGDATAFADDLALSYASIDNTTELQFILQNDLEKLCKWFYYHRLTVSDKSRVMRFGHPNMITYPLSLMYHVFSCDRNVCSSKCFKLEVVSEFKYLGLTIDMQLNWNSHLNNIRKNVVAAVHKFYNLRQFCSCHILRKLYHALVESIIMYGISSWGGIYFASIEDLYIAQKRIIKLIYNRPKFTPTIPLFRDLNLLPLRYLYVFKVLKMFFVRSDSFHYRITFTYNMRNPNQFAGSSCNKEKYRRFYLYMAPYWFHKLPKNLKGLATERKHKFEREIRVWLLNVDNIENHF